MSGTRLVTGTVRGARSRGARSRFNSEEYQTACGYPTLWFTLGHHDQSMICGEDFLLFPAVGLAALFCFARSGSDVANSSV